MRPRLAEPLPSPPELPEAGTVVRPSRFVGDDRALLKQLERGDPAAALVLYDRYAPHLRRVLARILGIDSELPDLLQETFARALAGVGKLRDPDRLQAWLTWIAVYTARGCIRKRRRWRWLELRSPERVDEAAAPSGAPDDGETLRRAYRVLDGLGADERIAFTLRYLEDLSLAELAEVCDVSLATMKRRLARAERAFAATAREDPLLRRWVDESPRWRNR